MTSDEIRGARGAKDAADDVLGRFTFVLVALPLVAALVFASLCGSFVALWGVSSLLETPDPTASCIGGMDCISTPRSAPPLLDEVVITTVSVAGILFVAVGLMTLAIALVSYAWSDRWPNRKYLIAPALGAVVVQTVFIVVAL